ncbi:MAG: DUF3326 domain-containing protein [Candidatus Aenigmarchaeota archaeon]|nr:DUF3326 domain-containing protein [Candidatus Aenigmarchaeota archaeon]
MKIYNERFVFEEEVDSPENLLDAVENFLRKKLPENTDFLRYAIVEVEGNKKVIEVAVISEVAGESGNMKAFAKPTLHDGKNHVSHRKKFAVANIVPTGVRAEVGGWIADATPVTNAMSECADWVIAHPNVLNGSFINYGNRKSLYTEGYLLDHFFRKQLNLKELATTNSHNKIGVILDRGAKDVDKDSLTLAINAVESLRAVAGIEIVDCIITKEPIGGKAVLRESGAFGGEVKNPKTFLDAAKELIDKGADAIAVATYISVSMDDLDAYFRCELPNPYGGVEALISHTISREFGVPSAHAPIVPQSEKEAFLAKGVVDPRIAGEVVTPAYLGSVLRGLQYAPHPVSRSMFDRASLGLEDVRAVVVPYTCCGGIPVLAAQKYGVPVIAVKENKTVLDVTPEKLNMKNVIIVDTYIEAFGILLTMKAGVSLESVRRPLTNLEIKGK